VKFALHDAEADDAVVHFTESLVVPLVLAGFDERFEIDELERTEFCVQIDGIWGLTGHASLPWLQRCAYFISGPREGVAGSATEKHAARDKAACAAFHERSDDQDNAHDEEIVVVVTGASVME
jgi:hypothetical protein